LQGIVQVDTVSAAATVDEDDDVLAQVALVVEHVAAQKRIDIEGAVERGAQASGAGLDLRHRGKAGKLLGKDESRHGTFENEDGRDKLADFSPKSLSCRYQLERINVRN